MNEYIKLFLWLKILFLDSVFRYRLHPDFGCSDSSHTSVLQRKQCCSPVHLYRLISFCKVLYSELRNSVCFRYFMFRRGRRLFQKKTELSVFQGMLSVGLDSWTEFKKTVSNTPCLPVKDSSSQAIIYRPISLRKSEGESGENKSKLFLDLEFLCSHLVFSVFPGRLWAGMVGIAMTVLLFNSKSFLWGGTFNYLVMREDFLRIHSPI